MSASAHDLNLLLAGGLKKLKAEIDQANAEWKGYHEVVFGALEGIGEEVVKLREQKEKVRKRLAMVELRLALSNERWADQDRRLIECQEEVDTGAPVEINGEPVPVQDRDPDTGSSKTPAA